ncbi:Ribosomal large subunit pseudouridine synthase D [Anoxybacillus sp. BCO1]|nr:Ribosomal large subunit pseudouridine synthase D [Anoxybacillus sp. BCO1]
MHIRCACSWICETKKGTIDAPIGRDRHHPTRRRVSKTGDTAITHYERLQYDKQKNVSLVRLTLDTGKTHQIRVHMSYIGHPLVGIRYIGKTVDRSTSVTRNLTFFSTSVYKRADHLFFPT